MSMSTSQLTGSRGSCSTTSARVAYKVKTVGLRERLFYVKIGGFVWQAQIDLTGSLDMYAYASWCTQGGEDMVGTGSLVEGACMG